MKKMNPLIWLLIGILLLFIIYIIISALVAISIFDPGTGTSSLKELKENLSLREHEIRVLKKYYNNTVPAGKEVYIEFKEDGSIDMLKIHSEESGISYYADFYADSRTNNNYLKDSMMMSLGWTSQTLTVMWNKLRDANCIAITNGEPAIIGFKRSGFGFYYYDVFDKPIPQNRIKEYNDSCYHIYYNPMIVFEYGGGAIGPQCFPDVDRKTVANKDSVIAF